MPVTSAPDDPAREAHRRYLGARYFGSLDGLRGISIIAVVWHHTAEYSHGILARGHLGVQLFFGISGLLITTLLLREQDKTGTVSLRDFYIRRTLRIFPLYYAVIAVYVVLVLLLERGTAPGRIFFSNLPSYLTYTSNWFVDLQSGNRVIFYFAWSLATEEQFYLVWPSVVRVARRWYGPPLFMIALLVAGEAARWAVAAGAGGDALWLRVLSSIATPICLGCVSAYLLYRPGLFGPTYRLAGQPWSAWVGAALLALCLIPDGMPMALISLAMIYLIVACAIRPDHGLRFLMENAALRYVGTISYGMYLLHMLAINTARRVLPHGAVVATFVVGLLLTILAASASHRWFEQRFLRLKERFRAAPAPKPIVAVAAEPRAGGG